VASQENLTAEQERRWAAKDESDQRWLRQLARARAPASRDQARERDAISQLLASWESYIDRYARLKAGTEGTDVAQDARRRLTRKLLSGSSFDVPFWAVVTRCLRDAVAAHYRWERRHGTTPVEDDQLAMHSEPDADPAERPVDPRADTAVLHAALADLGDPDAQIVYMKIVLDRPAREIAENLGLSEINVNTRFSRALPRLAQLIHEAVRTQNDPAEEQP
jgi:RNA polymerase sigma factor (sigma-70 family)